MSLERHRIGNTDVMSKVFTAVIGGRNLPIGIATRTMDAPVGYFPFYGVNDFDFSGTTSVRERLLAQIPLRFASVRSPHALLLAKVAEDPEFTGSDDMS